MFPFDKGRRLQMQHLMVLAIGPESIPTIGLINYSLQQFSILLSNFGSIVMYLCYKQGSVQTIKETEAFSRQSKDH